MPNPPGLSAGTPRTEHTSTIALAPDYATKWLPTPYPAASIKVDTGDWRFDRATLDVVGANDSTDGAGLSYQVEGLDLTPDAKQLVSAPPVPRPLYDANTEL